MPKYEITLTPHEVTQCLSRQRDIRGSIERIDDNNYTGLNAKDRFFIGECGEFAVRKWLDSFNIDYQHEQVTGRADEHDLAVRLASGMLISIDVKTSFNPRAAFLMIPHAQFDKHRHDSYIGCTGHLDEDTATVVMHGIISRANLKRGGVVTDRKVLTVEYPLHKLTPMAPELFDQHRSYN